MSMVPIRHAAGVAVVLAAVTAYAQTTPPPTERGKTPPVKPGQPPPPAPKPPEGEKPPAAAPPKSPPVSFIANLPEWAFDARWYYVVVPRFANGSKDNDPPGTRPWNEPWPAPGEVTSDEQRAALDARSYGGDLQGLSAKLPYLKDLGFNALVLSPVFAAGDELKSEAVDWRHVDDALGIKGSLAKVGDEGLERETWNWSASDGTFVAFLRDAHAAGFHVIIDIDFGSVGSGFWAMRDVRALGNQSPFVEWFDLTDTGSPLKWNGPDGPNGGRVYVARSKTGLHPLVENHIFDVLRRWMDPDADGDPSDGVDGWRVDGVDTIGHGFWKRLRGQVKRLNRDALLVGGLWRDPNAWLEGDQLDCVLNYKAGGFLRRFFASDTETVYPARRFMADLAAYRKTLEPGINLAMLNLVNGPDTERVLTRLARAKPERLPTPKPDHGNANDNAGGANANASQTEKAPATRRVDPLDRWRLLAAMRAFDVGAPVIYYGEEVGMTGGRPPFSRAPMWWPGKDGATPAGYRANLLELTRLLNTLRAAHEPLRRGTAKTLIADDDRRIIAVARSLPGHQVIVVLNGSTENQRVRLTAGRPGGLVGVLAPQLRPRRATGPGLHVNGSRSLVGPDGKVDIVLDPMSVRLLLVRD